jgi:hypothetical protein
MRCHHQVGHQRDVAVREPRDSDPVHARAVSGAPGIGEFRPVDPQPLLPCQVLYFTRDRGAPVDDRAKYVKDDCASL